MTNEDAELVALIDSELDEVANGRLLTRLTEDEALRKRYEELRDAGAPIAAAFDALVERSPLPRLRAALPRLSAPRTASRPFAGITLRELAACIVSFLLGGRRGLDRDERRATGRARRLACGSHRIHEPLYE